VTSRARHAGLWPLLLLCGVACDRGPPAAASRTGAVRDSLTPIDTLLAAGERTYFAGKYDSARSLWTAALDRSRAGRDSVREARALTWLGIRAWKLADYALARRLGEQALAMKRRWALQSDLFKSYNALGLVAWHEGRLGDAARLFGDAAAAAQASGDRTSHAVAAGNLGLIQFDLGEFAEARRGFDSMRVAGRAAGDARIEANALTNLGMLEVRVGSPREAVAQLTEAIGLYRGYDDANGLQVALAQLATAYHALGEPDRALAAVDTALTLARRAGLRHDEAENLETLAALHRAAGDHRRALRLYGETAALKRRLRLEIEAAADLRSQAEIHLVLGAVEQARELARAALAIHREAGTRVEELDDLVLLAEVDAQAGDRAAADSALSAAAVLADRFGTRRGRADVALAAARIADRFGDGPGTLAALRRAAGALASGGYGLEQEAHRLEMRALARAGRLDAAAAAGRRALAALEQVRGSYASAVLRTSYLAGHRATFDDLGDVLRRLGRAEDALEVADRARGRAVLEHLAAPRAAAPRDDFERRLARQDTLLKRIDILTEQADSAELAVAGGDPAGHDAARFLRTRLEEARTAYDDWLARASTALSPRAAAAGGLRLSVPALAAVLSTDEALLAYRIGADSLVVFTVSRGRTRTFTISASAGRLGARVRIARDLIERSRTRGDVRFEVLDSLHAMLIEPAERAGALHGVRRLIVVADGVLTYLPFAALRDRRGRWLASRYVVATVPSAAAFLALRSQPQPAAAGGSSRLEVFAPLTGALPATAVEAREVARLMPGAIVRRDNQATPRTLSQALAQHGTVHLATHAELNRHNPLFSRIRLRDRDGGAATLEVHEVLSLPVRSDLVFLSGCETGLGAGAGGAFEAGEDYATLARAFHYAGATEVIATLWRVEDRGAAELARRFYRHYRRMSVAEALARTQRELMGDPQYGSPFYWAGYVLSGDPGGIAAQSSRVVSVR
jgi:CHAT domain-containing protein/tetratricopeptide (TPR) repeat protein